MGMVVAQHLRAAAALCPMGVDESLRIDLETALGIGMDVVGRDDPIDPFALAQQDTAGLVRMGGRSVSEQPIQNISGQKHVRSP